MIYAVINRSFTGSRKPELEIGGAVRFNYNLSSWKEGQKNDGGDFGYDVFRINAKPSTKELTECRISLILRRFWAEC
jgi:hypothetical protein